MAFARHHPQTADGFRRRLQDNLRLLREFPEAGRPTLYDARALSLDPYPYDMIYRRYGADLVIIAVAHSRQRPGYWSDR
jgi:plasmid stabilization system protein ParE